MADAQRFDVAIVGAGIAGASCAFFLAPHRRVAILEREAQPGYHSTGRSAAAFIESYGNAPIRAATRASRPFLEAPPPGFAEHPLLRRRACVVAGPAEQLGRLREAFDEQRRALPAVRWLDAAELARRCPPLRPELFVAGFEEPGAADIDVHALLQGFLRGARAAGAQLLCGREVRALRRGAGGWTIETSGGAVEAGVVVNAAGAWASGLAALAGALPIELVPKRRTAITFDVPPEPWLDELPLLVDCDEQFYFKSDAGRILASPADETPLPPQDAQPDELDVATVADRIERFTRWQVRRIAAKWAGLRTFAADRTIVCGADPAAPGFFWLAGQGGYGVQTSPAMGRLAAGLIAGLPDDPAFAAEGLRAEDFSPARPGLSAHAGA